MVAKGYTQQGVDYTDTFAPVVKMQTVRTVLTLASKKKWPVFQLDVNNAFLHGILDEEVYVSLLTGFYKKEKAARKVCKLKKSLYGLKQASRQWFGRLSDALLSYGFSSSLNDYSLFNLTVANDFLILLVYVDDILITVTSATLIQDVKNFIDKEFHIKDLGEVHFFLGIEVSRSDSGIFINQRKYVLDLLSEAGLSGSKPSLLPMDPNHKLALSTSALLPDPTFYRKIVGQLIYLTITRPDLSYPVHILSQFMAHPIEDHLNAVFKTLRYLKGAPAKGLFYPSEGGLHLEAYCDADWASCPITRRSISGYTMLLGGCLISWKTKKQLVVSRSSIEAEYRAMANSTCEILWLLRLLTDLGHPQSTTVPLFCGNKSAIYLSDNPVFQERTKHIEIDCHFIRHHILSRTVRPRFIASANQPADIITKSLNSDALARH